MGFRLGLVWGDLSLAVPTKPENKRHLCPATWSNNQETPGTSNFLTPHAAQRVAKLLKQSHVLALRKPPATVGKGRSKCT